MESEFGESRYNKPVVLLECSLSRDYRVKTARGVAGGVGGTGGICPPPPLFSLIDRSWSSVIYDFLPEYQHWKLF